MDILLAVLRCAVPSFYLLTVVLYALRFAGRGERARVWARPVFWGTLGLHALFLTLFILVNRRIPLAALPEILSVVAFATSLAYFWVELRTRNLSTGLFVLSFSALLQLISSASIALVKNVPPLLSQPAFGLHTGAAILGYASFAVSAIYGLLFLLLYRALKATRFGLIYHRLPSLEVLASMNIGAALLGLCALSAAILTGVFWASRLYPGFSSDPMFLMTLAVWVVYAFCIVGHYWLGWRGRPTIYLSITGFLLMGVVLVAVNVLLPSFHRFDVL